MKQTRLALDSFFESLELQTISCLVKPKDGRYFDIYEIRDGKNIRIQSCNNDGKKDFWIDKLEECTDEKAGDELYKEMIKKSMKKGFVFNYVPKIIRLNYK
jgi:hypothetical protein